MTAEEKARAKKVDLVVLPYRLEGTNCSNCMYVRPGEDYCDNKDVDQKLEYGAKKMCCALWDTKDTKHVGADA